MGKKRKPKAKASGKVYQLKVTLMGSEPMIWRRVEVPGEYNLSKLHWIIQRVMDWENCHLHQFTIAERTYGEADVGFNEELFGLETLDEEKATLNELHLKPKSEFVYTYDFGDNWEHMLLVEEVLEADPDTKYPVCTGGEQAAPLEDSGGLWGYYDMLEILEDPDDPEYEHYAEWVGDRVDEAGFDLEKINKRLSRLR